MFIKTNTLKAKYPLDEVMHGHARSMITNVNTFKQSTKKNYQTCLLHFMKPCQSNVMKEIAVHIIQFSLIRLVSQELFLELIWTQGRWQPDYLEHRLYHKTLKILHLSVQIGNDNQLNLYVFLSFITNKYIKHRRY